jgi:hypothetical protein
MEITQKDINETRFVGELIKKINTIDLTEASNVSDRIVKNQPFIMSLLIGYKFDVEEDQLNDVMKMLFIIYLYFENKTNIGAKKIGPKEFEKYEKRNIQFLKYFSGEQNNKSQLEVNKQYLSNLKCKSLFTGILAMANTQISLKKMNSELKGIIVMGMKTLIDCLESNLLEKINERDK